MSENAEQVKQIKQDCRKLVVSLGSRSEKPAELLDIIDVLGQVADRVETAKNPAALVNRLVNYIRSVAMAGKIHFPTEDEKVMIDLSGIGQKAGLNGQYMADFSDKSQFYRPFSEVPRH